MKENYTNSHFVARGTKRGKNTNIDCLEKPRGTEFCFLYQLIVGIKILVQLCILTAGVLNTVPLPSVEVVCAASCQESSLINPLISASRKHTVLADPRPLSDFCSAKIPSWSTTASAARFYTEMTHVWVPQRWLGRMMFALTWLFIPARPACPPGPLRFFSFLFSCFV